MIAIIFILLDHYLVTGDLEFFGCFSIFEHTFVFLFGFLRVLFLILITGSST